MRTISVLSYIVGSSASLQLLLLVYTVFKMPPAQTHDSCLNQEPSIATAMETQNHIIAVMVLACIRTYEQSPCCVKLLEICSHETPAVPIVKICPSIIGHELNRGEYLGWGWGCFMLTGGGASYT